MSFLCYQGKFFTLVHGFFNGMFIEGGCRWGFDPIWTPRESVEVTDDDLVEKSEHTPAIRRFWIKLRAKQSEMRKKH